MEDIWVASVLNAPSKLEHQNQGGALKGCFLFPSCPVPQSVSDVKCLPLEGGYSLQVSWTCSPSVENSTFLILTSGVIGVTWLNCQEPAVVGNLQPARSYAIQVVTRWNGYLVESDPVVCSTDSTGKKFGSNVIGGIICAKLAHRLARADFAHMGCDREMQNSLFCIHMRQFYPLLASFASWGVWKPTCFTGTARLAKEPRGWF